MPVFVHDQGRSTGRDGVMSLGPICMKLPDKYMMSVGSSKKGATSEASRQ